MTRRGRALLWPTALLCFLALPSAIWASNASTDCTAADRSGLAAYDFRKPARRIALPRTLREASGLAASGPNSVVLHDDNNSRIYEIDLAPKRPKPIALPGMLQIDGDFEGIALVAGAPLLSDSSGRLLDPRQPQRFLPLPVAELRGHCGFEGLAYSAATQSLYLPCKYPRPPQANTLSVIVYTAFNPHTPELASAFELRIDVSKPLRAFRLTQLRPSAIELNAVGNLLILAGKERVLLEVDRLGAVMRWRRLSRWNHRQPEGLTLLTSGELLIADEGRWRGGAITVYPPRRQNTDQTGLRQRVTDDDSCGSAS